MHIYVRQYTAVYIDNIFGNLPSGEMGSKLWVRVTVHH